MFRPSVFVMLHMLYPSALTFSSLLKKLLKTRLLLLFALGARSPIRKFLTWQFFTVAPCTPLASFIPVERPVPLPLSLQPAQSRTTLFAPIVRPSPFLQKRLWGRVLLSVITPPHCACGSGMRGLLSSESQPSL